MAATEELTYLTADEPGIGGLIKLQPEDFVVDELPMFEPSGQGDHLYMLIEKRRRMTTDVVRLLSRHFSVPWRDVGYAGLKDKHAITRQWFSIEHAKEARAEQFEDETNGKHGHQAYVRILRMIRHSMKLKRGNLLGNRFTVKVRDVDCDQAAQAQRIIERLKVAGVPNFVGEQRFGYRNDNAKLGRFLLLGDLQGFLDLLLGKPQPYEQELNQQARRAYDEGDYAKSLKLWPTVHRFERQAVGPLSRGASAEHAVNGIDKPHRQLIVSAFQSEIFNRLLNERLKAGLLGKLQTGDLAFKHDTRGVFKVNDVDKEQPRCDRLEISPTGPMWGVKMAKAGGKVGQAEAEALAKTGITEDDLAKSEFRQDGSRRAMRMLVLDPEADSGEDEVGTYVRLQFRLARGCFATTVLREIMKT